MVSEHYYQSEGGERMADNMTLEELKQVIIDYHVNLQRIKKADTVSLGIPSEEYEM